jgi:hypothetical protein
MDNDYERQSDPKGLTDDDPAVVTAIDLVKWELSLYFGDEDTGDEPASSLMDSTDRRS